MSDFVFKLYVAGPSPRADAAVANLREIGDRYLDGRYELEIIDVLQHPDRADEDRILATPTLLCVRPFPGRKIVGDLSETDRVLVGLGLRRAVWTWRRGTT